MAIVRPTGALKAVADAAAMRSAAKALLAQQKEERIRKSPYNVEGVPFPVGQKKVFLPKFVVTLINTPHLDAKWARFSVPLWFSKLDIRDFLWHAYNVHIHTVRSYIQHAARARRYPGKRGYYPGRSTHYQPKQSKRMTVELDQPFVWPAPPEDLEPWDKKGFDRLVESRVDMQNLRNPDRPAEVRAKRVLPTRAGHELRGPQTPKRYMKFYSEQDQEDWTPHRVAMRARAERILRGEVKWGRRSTSPRMRNFISLRHGIP